MTDERLKELSTKASTICKDILDRRLKNQKPLEGITEEWVEHLQLFLVTEFDYNTDDSRIDLIELCAHLMADIQGQMAAQYLNPYK